MIDIHCHLLPGIDDGPKNWEQSVSLCKAMAADGIVKAVATPHLIDGVYNNTLSRVRPLTRQLNQRLAEAGVALEVLCGAEVDLSSRYVGSGSPELPRLGGGPAVLLEMPVAVLPQAMNEIMFSVRSQGLVPVLAHPERNELLQDTISLAKQWIDAGAALQLDGDSLLGVWGRRSKACAEQLIARGWYHAMASDAHSTDRRPPRLTEALGRAIELVGAEARTLVTSAPAEILAGRCPKTPLFTAAKQSSGPTGVVTRNRGLIDRLFARFG
ncbi:MAG: tyrosine-protein phosphatase [Candidatus Binatia bacterium]